ncbi:MAG: hypothetical protein II767_09940, partial [Proteobacteria bacterium]|nr:hypothetical protein [Pseudomonadota bacterium]
MKHRIALIILAACIGGGWGCSEGSDDDSGKQDPKDPNKQGQVVVTKCDPKDDVCLSKTEILHCVNGERVRE